LLLLAFFLYLTVINIFNINHVNYSFVNFTIFQNILLFIVLINFEYENPGAIQKAILYFAYGSLALCVFYFLGIGIEITEYGGGRVSLFGDNENNIGIRMAVSTIIFWVFFQKSKYRVLKKTIFYILPIPFLFTLLLATGSRVSLIAVLLASAASFILDKKKSNFFKLIWITVGAVVVLVAVNYILSTEVMGERIRKTIEEGALAGRDDIWIRVFPFLVDNLIFGAGTTGYSMFSLSEFGVQKSIHNVYLEILIYTGVFGFILYNYFLFHLIYKSFQLYKKNNNSLPLLLFIPIFGLLLSGQLLNVKLGWLIYAYTASQIAKLKKSY
jgi:O-antigen ligase